MTDASLAGRASEGGRSGASAAALCGGRASLPMYDWPETAPALDALWAGIRDRLRAEGIAAPESLERGAYADPWTAPDLVLSQTCGLPYARGLRGRVGLVGVLDLGLEGCPPGWYRSHVLRRRDDPREGLGGLRLAVNGRDSQSGAQAMMFHLRDHSDPPALFAEVIVSGGHETSAAMVAEGRADIAAIDAASWRLIEAHRPFASALRVVASTPPTPGLPLITRRDPEAVARAVEGALAARPDLAAALGIRGLVRMRPEDYDLVEERDAAMRSVSAAYGL